MRWIRFLIIILIFASNVNLYSQNAKKIWKGAQVYLDSKEYEKAINEFTKAIELDSTFTKAYIDRAYSLEQTGKLQEAANDYEIIVRLDEKDAELLYNAGRINFLINKFEKAYKYLEKATELNKKNLAAFQYEVKSLIELKKFEVAKVESEKAIALNEEDAQNYYYHGLISDSLSSFQRAEWDYNKAISINKNYEIAYIALAKVKSKLDKKREGVEVCSQVLNINTKNTDAYLTRAVIFHDLLEYPSAINDLSKIILLNPDSKEIYLLRGLYYKEFNQPQNAINDFTKVISSDNKNIEALLNRAQTYEDILNFESAIKDYQALTKLVGDDPKTGNLLAKAQAKLFELNKENNKPVIDLVDPFPKNSLIVTVADTLKKLKIKGIVKDQSELKYIKLNDVPVNFVKGEEAFEFESVINVSAKDRFTVLAVDVYDNVQTKIFVLDRTEVNKPMVSLLAPYASDNGEIYLDNDNNNLYVEGKITDDSKIKSILIEGTSASFAVDEKNPSFSATVNILNKNKFTVTAIDEYGNEAIKDFILNRESAVISENNPMGKTWVVFIENSNYESFASLEGPTKDVVMMKSALVNYEIHNIIHKQDLKKTELEKFFTIELRDLVRSNQVNSLVVWYAGHGKVINETGYWIPVDATRDDEFSYFNINTLKASMQQYSKYITHTLVITDACESGPTFYQAMRSGVKQDRSCDDWKDTKFKSSQVFSSAGYELAVDNSQFTKTFARALENNPDACIPIEDIVLQVQDAVKNNNQQAPKFGRIAGLEDENGTFFFISK